MNQINKKIGQNIKRIREQKGMSQGDIFRKLDMDRAYISRVESGLTNPTVETLAKIAWALGVGVDDLIK
jgi:transcriptional regulator with XRE-family HTH domain